MTAITRKPIDDTIEKQITTGMVTSTKFISEVLNVFNPQYMQNSFAKIICLWCLDYFEQYKKAPGSVIQEIFLIESESGLSREDAEIIKEFLNKLSSQYVEGQEINPDYVRDNAMIYFRKRELEIRTEQARRFLEIGKVEEAEAQFTQFKKVAYQTSGWFNPLSSAALSKVFGEESQGILVLPGALGEIVGPLERGWFVAILGPFKRGKSFLLQEMAVRSLLKRLKVVIFSFEMLKKGITERIARRLTAFGSRKGDDIFLYPTFDCKLNQLGTCARSERVNRVTLIGEDGLIPEFDIEMIYKPCIYCRERLIRDYKLATWFETMELPAFTQSSTQKYLSAFQETYGDNLRVKVYPRFSAGISEIRRDLLILEQHEEFIPDVIVIDYADILKPEVSSRSLSPTKVIDDIWKNISALAADRHALTFSASQGTRGAIYKSDLAQDDLAEWIGKLGHVEVFLGLNQTKEEKRSKIIRVSGLVHRYRDVDENLSAVLLQQLEIGQPALDSELVWRKG